MMAINRFLRTLWEAQADGPRVILGLPGIFGTMILLYFAQRGIAYHMGLFDTRATSGALTPHEWVTVLGWLDLAIIEVGRFFAIRYLMLGEARAALRPSVTVALRYLPYFAYTLSMLAVIFYADRIVADAWAGTLRATTGMAILVIEPLLMPWAVSAATDGPIRHPGQSAWVVGRWYPWALALFFLGRLPIMALHDDVSGWPEGQEPWIAWAGLAAESVSVGLMATIIPALSVRTVAQLGTGRRADRRAAVAHPVVATH